MAAGAGSSAYVNPVPKTVTPERIDMGVDYAGSGNYLAIGNGVVTQVNPGGWGKYGNYIAYKLTDGPLAGREIYYAEGVTPHVKVGQKLSAGQIVASIIPGWQYGTEIGYGSGHTNTAAASPYYTEGARTAAGQAFSDLIKQLGGPPGLAEGRPVTGAATRLGVPQGVTGLAPGSVVMPAGGSATPAPAAAASAGLFGHTSDSGFLYATIWVGALLTGVWLLYQGLDRATHGKVSGAAHTAARDTATVAGVAARVPK